MKLLQSEHLICLLVLQQAFWGLSVLLWGGDLSPHPLGAQRTWNKAAACHFCLRCSHKGSSLWHCPVTLSSLWAEISKDRLKPSPRRGKYETTLWMVSFSLTTSTTWAILVNERSSSSALNFRHKEPGWCFHLSVLLCLAQFFNVTVTGKSVELKVKKMTLEIPDYGYSLCLTVHKYCI